jgi:hypothetical protein
MSPKMSAAETTPVPEGKSGTGSGTGTGTGNALSFDDMRKWFA